MSILSAGVSPLDGGAARSIYVHCNLRCAAKQEPTTRSPIYRSLALTHVCPYPAFLGLYCVGTVIPLVAVSISRRAGALLPLLLLLPLLIRISHSALE